jgi:hypothetical protein
MVPSLDITFRTMGFSGRRIWLRLNLRGICNGWGSTMRSNQWNINKHRRKVEKIH